jgi:hypothetical protein
MRWEMSELCGKLEDTRTAFFENKNVFNEKKR